MIEPSLQPLTGKTFPLLSTVTYDGVQLEVRARCFYRPGQLMRIFRYSCETILERAEKEKKMEV